MAVDVSWQDEGLCRQVGPDGWTQDDGKSHESVMAKRICQSCPVKDQCLKFALDNDLDYYIYGGLGPTDRRKLKRSIRNGTTTG